MLVLKSSRSGVLLWSANASPPSSYITKSAQAYPKWVLIALDPRTMDQPSTSIRYGPATRSPLFIYRVYTSISIRDALVLSAARIPRTPGRIQVGFRLDWEPARRTPYVARLLLPHRSREPISSQPAPPPCRLWRKPRCDLSRFRGQFAGRWQHGSQKNQNSLFQAY